MSEAILSVPALGWSYLVGWSRDPAEGAFVVSNIAVNIERKFDCDNKEL